MYFGEGLPHFVVVDVDLLPVFLEQLLLLAVVFFVRREQQFLVFFGEFECGNLPGHEWPLHFILPVVVALTGTVCGPLDFGQHLLNAFANFLRGEKHILLPRAGEGGRDFVIVASRDRIVFVIVAAGAAQGEAKHGRSDAADDVIELFILCLLAHPYVGDGRARCKEAGELDCQLFLGLVLVTGELPLDELVVRQVAVQCLDDRIPVSVGIRAIVVGRITMALSEASDVQPVSPPSFTVVRIFEQLLDQLLPGAIRFIFHEGFHFIRFRR